MNVAVGLRMLRSAPALGLVDVADGVGVGPGAVKAEVGRLKGRGHGAQRAVSLSYHHGNPGRRRLVLQSRVCPPFAARRAAWDRSRVVRRSAPGVAGWSSRSTDSVTAPRVAYAKAAADPATRFEAAQPGCPVAMAARLATGHRFTTERLAVVTPHRVVLAALVAAVDDNTRRVAAARRDLPTVLAPKALRRGLR